MKMIQFLINLLVFFLLAVILIWLITPFQIIDALNSLNLNKDQSDDLYYLEEVMSYSIHNSLIIPMFVYYMMEWLMFFQTNTARDKFRLWTYYCFMLLGCFLRPLYKEK